MFAAPHRGDHRGIIREAVVRVFVVGLGAVLAVEDRFARIAAVHLVGPFAVGAVLVEEDHVRQQHGFVVLLGRRVRDVDRQTCGVERTDVAEGRGEVTRDVGVVAQAADLVARAPSDDAGMVVTLYDKFREPAHRHGMVGFDIVVLVPERDLLEDEHSLFVEVVQHLFGQGQMAQPCHVDAAALHPVDVAAVNLGRQRVAVERVVGNPVRAVQPHALAVEQQAVAVDLDFADAEAFGDGRSVAIGCRGCVEMRVVEIPQPGLADAERDEHLAVSGGTGLTPGHDTAFGIGHRNLDDTLLRAVEENFYAYLGAAFLEVGLRADEQPLDAFAGHRAQGDRTTDAAPVPCSA